MDTVAIPRAEYPPGWFEVTVQDQFRGWDWADNSYRLWCQINCTGDFSATKTHRERVTAKFELETDALLFMLRWM